MIYKVWDDNNGAFVLESSPIITMTPSSKNIGVKYNWFDFWFESKSVCMKPIDSDNPKRYFPRS